jgi:anti-anti-sigma regulatory factor
MPATDTALLETPAAVPDQVAMATFDAALLCTYANDRFAEVAGLDDGAAVGRSWRSLFPGLAPGQQAVVDAVAGAGPAVGEVDVTTAATGRPGAPVGARQRWRLVLHRVQGVPGVVKGRMLSVVGSLATGPVVLDPPAFRHRLADTLRAADGPPGVLLVDLGPEPETGLASRASALRGVVRATDVVSLDVDESSGRSYLALLCPDLPAPWTAAAIGDRLRRTAQLSEGLAGDELPQVSVTVARPDDSAESLLRRASRSLHTELRADPPVLVDAAPLRTTVRKHTVRAGSAVVLRLAGEADLSTLRGLIRLLDAIVEDRPAGLVVDASALAFCDVATVRALVTVTDRAARAGAVVGVAGMPTTMERVFSLGWSGSSLQRWGSVEEALAAL